jgi:hypothetical protein
MKSYGRLTTGIIAAWFVIILSASALHLFENDSNRVGPVIGMAALAPIVVFALWLAASDKFRQFALSLNPSALTLAQSWRILGFTFVLLQAHDILPAVFALPAGYGDMAIGVTASLATWKLVSPGRRGGFILWQALGITDLVMAVSLGTAASLLNPHGPSMAAMTALPLSLVPTFIVPLLLIFHIICIAQARTWKAPSGDTWQAARMAQDSLTANAAPSIR